MSERNKRFIEFSKPFIDSLKETFSLMMDSQIRPLAPKIKDCNLTRGEFTSIIGMNGALSVNGVQKSFKGLVALSFDLETYLRVSSALLGEEYTEYSEEIADTGAEIANIIMGNAKRCLAPKGYDIGMATPGTIRGKNVKISYPKGTTIIETTIESDLGSFVLEICYQEEQ